MGEDSNDWPAAAVAITLLILIGAVTIAAIYNPGSLAAALQIWEAMLALLGLFTGAFVTFFFTRTAVTAAQLQARSAMLLAAQQQRRADATQQALTKAAGLLEREEWQKLLDDPVVHIATSLADDATKGADRGQPG